MSRETCLKCFRVVRLCLCSQITAFQIEPLIVLLTHPREFMKTIGTVRLVKLSVMGSKLMRGTGPEFDRDSEFLSLIENPSLYPMVLFPGPKSLNLSTATLETLTATIPTDQRLMICVIDGTWTEAKQMIRESKILSALPQLSFDVHTTSKYIFRKQPKALCLSTVEAVTLLIENLKQKKLCTPCPENGHYQMVHAFTHLVEAQLKYELNRS